MLVLIYMVQRRMFIEELVFEQLRDQDLYFKREMIWVKYVEVNILNIVFK